MNLKTCGQITLLLTILFHACIALAEDPRSSLMKMKIELVEHSDMTADEKSKEIAKLRKEYEVSAIATSNAAADANRRFEESPKAPSDAAKLYLKQQEIKGDEIRKSNMTQEEKLEAFRQKQRDMMKSIGSMSNEERNAVGNEAKKNFDEISKALDE